MNRWTGARRIDAATPLRRQLWTCTVAVSLALATLSGAAEETVLKDGTRFERTGNQLFLFDKAGVKTLAKDGTYLTRDGKKLVVKGGKLVVAQQPPASRVPKKGPGPQQIVESTNVITTQTETDKMTATVDPSVKYGTQPGRPAEQGVKGKILQTQPGGQPAQPPAQPAPAQKTTPGS
jgi:hypothetical protein